MQNSIFYVKDDSNKNLVAAKFLYNGGAPVLDPNFDKAESEHIFDSNGDLLPAQNIHGYLIVPSDYSVQNAVKFARSVSDEMTITVEGPDGQEMTGFGPALEMMAAAFFSGGSQDLQRVYNGQKGKFMSAFTDAASFNLGLVTAYSGLPLTWAEFGGGAYNEIKARLTHPNHPLDTKGIDGLSEVNSNSVQAGYKYGLGLAGSQTQTLADCPLKQVDHDWVPPSDTKINKPTPSKPTAGHTTAALDMFDFHESSLAITQAQDKNGDDPGEDVGYPNPFAAPNGVTPSQAPENLDHFASNVAPGAKNPGQAARSDLRNIESDVDSRISDFDSAVSSLMGNPPQKTGEPESSKPAADQPRAALDMLDPYYERLFADMDIRAPYHDSPNWVAPAGPDPMQVNDPSIAVAERLFQAELMAAPIPPAHGAKAAIVADQPGLPPGSIPQTVATGMGRDDIETAATRHRPAPPPSGRQAPTGHRNDPIFVYTNSNQVTH